MDIQSVAPEIIQDTVTAPVPDADPKPSLPLSLSSSTAPIPVPVDEIDVTFGTSTIDLISSLLPRTTILSLSNEFFAPATSLLSPLPPISKPNTFIPTGAWYDGWETRRHNPAPYDYVVIRLGVDVGRVRGVEIDTAWFTGNNAEGGSVEGLFLDGEGGDDGEGKERDWEAEEWKEILPMQRLGPSRRHAWMLGEVSQRITHVRLRNYPDGGIARFRLYGLAEPFALSPPSSSSLTTTSSPPPPPLENLASISSGALITAFSDAHYGKALNLLLPGRGVNMGDGWETKRSRTPGHEDWCVIKLSGDDGGGGRVEKVVVDTKDFKGNYPRGVRIEGRRGRGKMEEGKIAGEGIGEDNEDEWKVLVGEGEWEIGPDREHEVEVQGKDGRREMVVGEVKVVMIPDGGIKRVRVWGRRVS